MQQIAEWLTKIGLERYTAAFVDNDIDVSVLRHLTNADLEKIGVSLGHRRKILAAIAELPVTSHASEQPASAETTKTQDTAERRQVTVLFADLVGSTALSARMDPEDLREVMAAYHECAVETVRRFDGFLAQFLGDGVVVYFGYPHAHEDDAERAVRAGLQLIEAVAGLKTSATLETRVGIASGVVVVGDLMRTGNPLERGIIGETPNLAARLQGMAEPNMVAIAEGTRRLLGNLFELQDLGSKDLKGFAASVRAFAALRASSVASRFEALHASSLTALVGREKENELLLRCWSKAKDGEGQVVLLSGEAGIGKSRLTAALLEALAPEFRTRLRYFCSPQHTDSALYPMIGQMERDAGLARDDGVRMKLDKLDALLAQTSTSRPDAALFAEMLSLPNDGRYPVLDLVPQQRRQRLLDALIARTEGLARQNPVLMIFEDAHWTDPTSLEALGRTIERIRGVRVLLLVTSRPEFAPLWIGRPHVTALTLNRLTARDIEAMIDHVAGDKPLPARIRQEIIERTDGIPLFVEEMTKAVLEAGSEPAAARTAAAIPPLALAVPASLHATLMARLDRLGPAKEVAQIGAAIGRELPHALLAAVVRKPEAELNLALARLIQAGLLLPQGTGPNATYLFNHALVQDAAYATLLRGPRRALHARIAETIENHFNDIAENQPERLARHCAEAGLIEKAAALWGKAGQRSLARSALVEAAEQLRRALAQIASLPATPAMRREAIKFQVALITPLIHLAGYAAPETKAAVEKARLLIEQAAALGETPDDPLLLFSVLYGFWVASYIAFNGNSTCGLAWQFLTLAEKQGATIPLMIGHRLVGGSLVFSGDIGNGRAHLNNAIALYDPGEHGALATRFGLDIKVAILNYRSLAAWALGYPEGALTDTDDSLKTGREIGQAATLMNGLPFATMIHILCGSYARASALADELIALAELKGALLWQACGMLGKGTIFAATGQASEAVQMISTGVVAYRSTGATVTVPLYLLHLAAAQAELGQSDDAHRSISEALTAIETTKEKWFEAEAHRVAGETALKLPDPDAAKAQVYFERALAIAHEQQAKSWELRAAMSMARLWRDQGKRKEARDVLAPVHNWFTEGFDTLDLKEARALLDQLVS